MVAQHIEIAGHSDMWTDLDQEAYFSTVTRATPTLLSHGCPTTLASCRIMTPNEMLVTQGIHDFKTQPAMHAAAPWHDACSRLSDAQKQDLIGNTMHCEVMMSIIAFIIRTAHHVADPDDSQEDVTACNSESNDESASAQDELGHEPEAKRHRQ